MRCMSHMSYRSRLEMGQVAKVHLEKQTGFQQQMLGICLDILRSEMIKPDGPKIILLAILFGDFLHKLRAHLNFMTFFRSFQHLWR